MDILLITQPKLKNKEAYYICKLFETGLKKLHIRKPSYDALQISRLLDEIPDHFLSSIVMHRHPKLVADYGLAGYHHADGEELRNCSGTASRSLHNLKDLASIDENLDYVFFGPVFKSISKNGYEPKVPLYKIEEVITAISRNKARPKIYALGGIRRKKISLLKNTGFEGFALLGSVWGHSDPVNAFRKFNQNCSHSLFTIN